MSVLLADQVCGLFHVMSLSDSTGARPLWDGDTKTDVTNFCSVHYPSSHRCLGIYAWQWSLLFILFITYYNVTLCLEFTQWCGTRKEAQVHERTKASCIVHLNCYAHSQGQSSSHGRGRRGWMKLASLFFCVGTWDGNRARA